MHSPVQHKHEPTSTPSDKASLAINMACGSISANHVKPRLLHSGCSQHARAEGRKEGRKHADSSLLHPNLEVAMDDVLIVQVLDGPEEGPH